MGRAPNENVTAGDSASEPSNGEANGSASKSSPERPAQLPEDEPPTEQQGEGEADVLPQGLFQLFVQLPHDKSKLEITVTPAEQVQEIRQAIQDSASGLQYSCFHLEHNHRRINDYVELHDLPGIVEEPNLALVEDPYNERDARLHVLRVRDLLAINGRGEVGIGLSPGHSLYERVHASQWLPSGPHENPGHRGLRKPLTTEQFVNEPFPWEVKPDFKILLDPDAPALPKSLKSLNISAWSPPTAPLRLRGYHLFLRFVSNERQTFHLTSHSSGFWVNRSTDTHFDPAPRSANPDERAHSLLVLLRSLSPSLTATLKTLQDTGLEREILTILQPANPGLPSYPWMVDRKAAELGSAEADIGRSQTQLLTAGIENLENVRDWGEELAAARELPVKSIQDRVARERLLVRLFAEFNEAALRGAMLVASGDLVALNPTEPREAQIFMYGNIFFSFGADGVGAFAKEGGNDAARAVVGLDVNGVRAVNQLDIEGLFTPGTGIIDYLGKRIVCQSVIPGIFKERKEGESQISYGGVDSRDVVASNPAFTDVFQKLSDALKIKPHRVWDKRGAGHDLEGSVETKGILGTDGRRYVLDVYRLQPLDIAWVEKHWGSQDPSEERVSDGDQDHYPHRMSVLRPELVEAYWKVKRRQWIDDEVAKRKPTQQSGTEESKNLNGESKTDTVEDKLARADSASELNRFDEDNGESKIDLSDFKLSFNPDVFCGQKPQTDEEKSELQADEQQVRDVCEFLIEEVIPALMHDLREGDVGFPMDGESLARTLHRRGVNIRYLGLIAERCAESGPRLSALNLLCRQEMVTRAFKHVANAELAPLPQAAVPACIAHLFNCLLGSRVNSEPVADLDVELRTLYPDCAFSFTEMTVEKLWEKILTEISRRYRFKEDAETARAFQTLPCLREVCLKLGIQIAARKYAFTKAECETVSSAKRALLTGVVQPAANGESSSTASLSKKQKKKAAITMPQASSTPAKIDQQVTFAPEDILNVVPRMKEASPKSALAQEALEAGQLAILQGQKELGQELVFESLSLHEQIFGLIHPEVARVYYQLSNLYFQLEDKKAAVELARKAAIVSERTLGVDSAETVLAYLNLGLYEHAVGKAPNALTMLKHGIKLLQLIYGPDHPDLVTTYNNGAVMLQAMKLYGESRSWFETALALCEDLFGRQSIAVATLLFQLAQALALDNDPKSSVRCMREAWSIFKDKLGPEDKNTTESAQWLVTLTQNAVNKAKYIQQLEKQGIQVRHVHKTQWHTKPNAPAGLNNTGRPMSSSKEVKLESQGMDNVDPRNLDELLKTIEGAASAVKKGGSANSSPKKGQIPGARHRKRKSPNRNGTTAKSREEVNGTRS